MEEDEEEKESRKTEEVISKIIEEEMMKMGRGGDRLGEGGVPADHWAEKDDRPTLGGRRSTPNQDCIAL